MPQCHFESIRSNIFNIVNLVSLATWRSRPSMILFVCVLYLRTSASEWFVLQMQTNEWASACALILALLAVPLMWLAPCSLLTNWRVLFSQPQSLICNQTKKSPLFYSPLPFDQSCVFVFVCVWGFTGTCWGGVCMWKLCTVLEENKWYKLA